MSETASQKCPHCTGGFGLKYPLIETNNFLVVCDAHPLTEGHIMIIPKAHTSCMAALKGKLFTEYKELYQKCCCFSQKTYGKTAAFEHGITCQTVSHAHTHFLPFDKSVRNIIPEKDMITKIQGLDDIKTEFKKSGNYLFVAINYDMWLINTKVELPRFFRDRFAKSLGKSERSDWKNARDNPELAKSFEKDALSLKEKWNAQH